MTRAGIVAGFEITAEEALKIPPPLVIRTGKRILFGQWLYDVEQGEVISIPLDDIRLTVRLADFIFNTWHHYSSDFRPIQKYFVQL